MEKCSPAELEAGTVVATAPVRSGYVIGRFCVVGVGDFCDAFVKNEIRSMRAVSADGQFFVADGQPITIAAQTLDVKRQLKRADAKPEFSGVAAALAASAQIDLERLRR